jgi:hypothetical protein
MRRIAIVVMALSLLGLSGCVVQVGTEHGTAVTTIGGLASGYVSLESLPKYDGTIFRFGIFDMGERPGEIASADLWPLAGAAVGIIGARARILMLGAGAGVLWYQPKPPPPPPPPTSP